MGKQECSDRRKRSTRHAAILGRRQGTCETRIRLELNMELDEPDSVWKDTTPSRRSPNKRTHPYAEASTGASTSAVLVHKGFNDLSSNPKHARTETRQATANQGVRSPSANQCSYEYSLSANQMEFNIQPRTLLTNQNDWMSSNQQNCTSPTCMSFDDDQINELKSMSTNADIDKVDDKVNYKVNDKVNNSKVTLRSKNTQPLNNDTSLRFDGMDCAMAPQEMMRGIPFDSDDNVVSVSRHTYPKAANTRQGRYDYRPRSDGCLTFDKDLENDGIVTTCVETTWSSTTPPGVAEDYPDTCKFSHTKRRLFQIWRKDDQNSIVYIYHDHATDDTILGDKFGIHILTDDSSKKDGYFRHFCNKVVAGSPACKMHMRNNDELVMVDRRFVPELDHEQILRLFSRVPVDGVTRFELVLRRKLPSPIGLPMSRGWEWFETSAILVPELNEEPKTRDPIVKRLPNNIFDQWTWQRYKVVGTDYYLTLSCDGVGVDVLYDDKTRDKHKLIHKHAKVCEDEHDPTKMDFLASLSCVDNPSYLSIDLMSRQVVTVKKESFFRYRTQGSDIYFKLKDVYLHCQNKKIVAGDTLQYSFTEFPMPGHKDVVDEIDGGYISGSPPEISSRRITRSMSRQESMNTRLGQMNLD